MSTPSITKSSTRMDEDYDCTSESIGVRSISTKKTTLKIVEPDSFNGNPANFRRFKRQYGLYLCANKETYPGDEEKIMFVLSYMKEGSAELWAGSYIDKVVVLKNWGDWEEFTAQLEHNFTDRNKVRRAMEKLDNQKQGREGASVYFLRIEQHAAATGIDLLTDPHAILRCERGLNEDLVDRIYSGGLIPNTYAGYRDHAIALDNIARSRASWKENNPGQKGFEPQNNDTTQNKQKEVQKVIPMQVDGFKTKNPNGYNCNKPGHFARNCAEPKKTENRFITISKTEPEMTGEPGFPQENT